jgi:Na+-transporting NADH:ubiquinone oxidoreductase subunit C
MLLGGFVTLVAWFGFNYTQPIIQENADIRVSENIALLYSPEDGYTKNDNQEFNKYRQLSREYSDVINDIYEVLNSDGEVFVVIYNVTTQGRNGPVSALIAINPYTDTVVAVTYYAHTETPNLGERYTREEEYSKLIGQIVGNVDVDVIAGASTTWVAIDQMFERIDIHYNAEGVHIDE